MKPSDVMPVGSSARDRSDRLRRRSGRARHYDADAEGDQQLVFVRAGVEVADDDPFHHHADHQDEQRPRDNREDKQSGIGISNIAGVAAEHEHRAMREVEYPSVP